VTPEQARALLAAPELLAAASADDLRVAERLRQRWPADLVAAASEQAELRHRAAAKTDRAESLLLTRAGLEQASSDRVAAHRAQRFAEVDGSVLDLCCGVGFDLRALAAVCDAVGVDVDETSAICAAHNAGAATVVADVRDVRAGRAAAAFVDPARRTGDRRGGYEPPLAWCVAPPAVRTAVKTAPGLDLSVVPAGWEVEFVAEGRSLKEACLWSPAWATAARRATVLSADAPSATLAMPLAAYADVPAARVAPPGGYVLDPSPAVTRAGLVGQLAADLDAWQIDPRIAFLSADVPLRSPFGRGLRVEASLPFSVKALAAELRRLDVGTVDLRRRGLAGDVDDLRRRLRPSGSRRAVVLLTRHHDRPWTVVCTEPDPS
jgi:SAM-dependent methyltransferase